MVDELRTNEENATDEVTMEQLMQQYDAETTDKYQRGKIVEGKVIDENEEGWLVDVNYKCEGFLPRREWTTQSLTDNTPMPKIGDTIKVQIMSMGKGDEAQLGLSRWRVVFDECWKAVEEAAEKGETVTVTGIRKVKGGLIASYKGIEGFIPVSQLSETGRGANVDQFVGKEFEAKLVERDRRKRRLVFSRRLIAEEEAKALKDAFFANAEEGSILEGTVVSVPTFGAFVSLGAVEGLVHISELGWKRSGKPSDVVSVGDKVKVKIIKLDKENGKISLSIKQTQPDPWENAAANWPKGTVTEGRVVSLTDFGAFVEIEPGLEGLVHIGDLSWKRVKKASDVLKKGDKVKVSIIDVDMDRKRLSLGYKQLHDPWAEIDEKYKPGQEVPAKIVRLADFGAFAQLEDGIEGLVHISQICGKRIEHPKEAIEIGQEVTARILGVDPVARRIRLSLRTAEEEAAMRQEREEAKAAKAEAAEKRKEEREARRKAAEEKKAAEEAQFPKEEVSVTIGDFLNQEKTENQEKPEEE